MKKWAILLFIGIFAAFGFYGCNKNRQEVYVYNWTEYMPDSVIKKFEKETGIKVVYATYDSNELMYSKIKLQKGAGYDLIVPSAYFVPKMAKEGLLMELDHSKLPNMKNLNENLLDQSYDPGNKYSLPYMWGASIIAYNDKFVDGSTITSWGDLWRPEFEGKLLLQNDVREVFAIALIILGYDGNSTSEDEISAAYAKLTTLMPNVRVFNSDSPKQPFINEEVQIGMLWTGEAFRAGRANSHIQYVYPKEGAILWVDCLSIPSGAKNVENAYKLMDFLMRPDIALEIATEIGYSSPNKEAILLMDEETRDNRLMNPGAEELKNARFQSDVGEAILIYERYWERLKTGR